MNELEEIMNQQNIEAAKGDVPEQNAEQNAQPNQGEIMPEEMNPQNAPLQEAPQQEVPVQNPAPAALDINAVLAQIEQLKTQNAQLQQAFSQQAELTKQQSEAAQANVIEQILQPPKPLNLETLQYGTEDEVALEQKRFNDENAAYIEAKIKEVAKPVMERYEAETKAAEFANAINGLSGQREFADIKSKEAHIREIIKKNEFLSALPVDRAVGTAYLISKGFDAATAEPQPPAPQKTVDDLYNEIKSDPKTYDEVMRRLTLENAKAASSGANIPILGSSQGLSTASPTLQEKPKTIDEAYRQTLKDYYKN